MQQQGLSLLELLCVLSIAAIMTTLAVPVYRTFFSVSTERMLGEQLLRAINMARSEAAIRDMPVTLCGSADHVTCSGDWQKGQILFVDEEQNGVVLHPEQVLRVFSLPVHGVLSWRSALGRGYLQVLPPGSTQGENGTFAYYPDEAKTPVWKIIVNKAGRARYRQTSDALPLSQ